MVISSQKMLTLYCMENQSYIVHYIFCLGNSSLFFMFKTGTAGQVSKHNEYVCFINIFLGVGSFVR